MRKALLKLISLSFFLTVGLTFVALGIADTDPCPNGEDMKAQELPENIQSYISANYSGNEIDDVERYNMDGVITYRVELEGVDDTELVFDINGVLLGSFLEKDIDQSVLPALAMDNINSAFLGMSIDKINMEISWTGQPVYEVELSNEVEVMLDMQGNMVCEEN